MTQLQEAFFKAHSELSNNDPSTPVLLSKIKEKLYDNLKGKRMSGLTSNLTRKKLISIYKLGSNSTINDAYIVCLFKSYQEVIERHSQDG